MSSKKPLTSEDVLSISFTDGIIEKLNEIASVRGTQSISDILSLSIAFTHGILAHTSHGEVLLLDWEAAQEIIRLSGHVSQALINVKPDTKGMVS